MTTLNYVVYALTGLLALIALIYGIKRYLEYRKEKITGVSANLEAKYKLALTKDSAEKLEILNSLINAKVFVNILVKNNLAKAKVSLFIGLIVHQSQVYILSNLVKLKRNYDSILIEAKALYHLNNKDEKKLDHDFNFALINDQLKWFERKKIKAEFIFLLNEELDKALIQNHSSYRALNIYDLEQEIKNTTAKNINAKKITELLKNANLFKEKT